MTSYPRTGVDYSLHVEAVYRRLTEKKLDEIDPDWRVRFKDEDGADFKAAERFYWHELQVIARPRDRLTEDDE